MCIDEQNHHASTAIRIQHPSTHFAEHVNAICRSLTAFQKHKIGTPEGHTTAAKQSVCEARPYSVPEPMEALEKHSIWRKGQLRLCAHRYALTFSALCVVSADRLHCKVVHTSNRLGVPSMRKGMQCLQAPLSLQQDMVNFGRAVGQAPRVLIDRTLQMAQKGWRVKREGNKEPHYGSCRLKLQQ